MRKDILDKKDDILEWINENQSKSFICEQLKCKQETLNKYLKIMDIVYDGNQSGKGYTNKRESMSAEEYIKESIDPQTNKIKLKLLKEGLKPYKCECCGLSEWMGELIPLELHHKDGNRFNNEFNNFQLLCPNCHALTNSYRCKNCKKDKASNIDKTVRKTKIQKYYYQNCENSLNETQISA